MPSIATPIKKLPDALECSSRDMSRDHGAEGGGAENAVLFGDGSSSLKPLETVRGQVASVNAAGAHHQC
jgi:hypothetical protein